MLFECVADSCVRGAYLALAHHAQGIEGSVFFEGYQGLSVVVDRRSMIAAHSRDIAESVAGGGEVQSPFSLIGMLINEFVSECQSFVEAILSALEVALPLQDITNVLVADQVVLNKDRITGFLLAQIGAEFECLLVMNEGAFQVALFKQDLTQHRSADRQRSSGLYVVGDRLEDFLSDRQSLREAGTCLGQASIVHGDLANALVSRGEQIFVLSRSASRQSLCDFERRSVVIES